MKICWNLIYMVYELCFMVVSCPPCYVIYLCSFSQELLVDQFAYAVPGLIILFLHHKAIFLNMKKYMILCNANAFKKAIKYGQFVEVLSILRKLWNFIWENDQINISEYFTELTFQHFLSQNNYIVFIFERLGKFIY